MFENVGTKLKKLAKFIFVFGLILSIIIFIIILAISFNGDGDSPIWLAFIIIVVGPLSSYLSSLPLYALGEIHEKIKE